MQIIPNLPKNRYFFMCIYNMKSFINYYKQIKKYKYKKISKKLLDSIDIEWKLVIRNRNTRLLPVLLIIWLILVILIPTYSTLAHVMFLILSVSFYTIQSFNYKSTFYDGLLSRPFQYISFIKNSYITSIIFMSIIFFTVILIYAITKNYTHIFLTICLFIYGSGISIYIFIFLGMFDIKRIELNSSSFNNFSNFSFTKLRFTFLPIILILLPPPILVLSISDILYASMSIGLLGIGSLIFHTKWISFLANTLQRRKYIMLEEFRHS